VNPLIILITLNLLAADAPIFRAETVDGRQLTGQLTALTNEAVTLQADDKTQDLALEDLLSLSLQKARPQKPPLAVSEPEPIDVGLDPGTWLKAEVGLTDGSLLGANSFVTTSEQAEVDTNSVGLLSIPTSNVAYVLFRLMTPQQQQQWDEILRKEIDQDLLVIAKGDSLDYLGGVVQSVGEETIEFNLDGDVIPVPRTKAFAVRYYRADSPNQAKPLGRLRDTGGSVWPLKEATLDGDQLQCTTPLGIQIALRLEDVVHIDFVSSALVYLSDLTPDSYRWTPYFGTAQAVPSFLEFYRPRSDTSLNSEPLKLDGKEYTHGLALHSRTELTYRLAEPYERLQAIAGIDDSLRPRGNVRLHILGDDRTLLDTTVSGSEPAQPIEVKLEGVTTLKIIVDFGSGLDIADHLILAEAKLLK
jgi:hypothetical protein